MYGSLPPFGAFSLCRSSVSRFCFSSTLILFLFAPTSLFFLFSSLVLGYRNTTGAGAVAIVSNVSKRTILHSKSVMMMSDGDDDDDAMMTMMMTMIIIRAE
jgi:hypothetical protein